MREEMCDSYSLLMNQNMRARPQPNKGKNVARQNEHESKKLGTVERGE